ncbi:hypothetical protein O6H91_10G026300 [Diphasiastrum complanatum]|uniref:Uncharacterized protein n=1 Tax=Diphasiastrum complanatum TaxID=34168 RepID=A0ACC2CFG1_DIPCM|nr:hypothetical protein O6H91_10G026300 [Diphasiastrum complanatum]
MTTSAASAAAISIRNVVQIHTIPSSSSSCSSRSSSAMRFAALYEPKKNKSHCLSSSSSSSSSAMLRWQTNSLLPPLTTYKTTVSYLKYGSRDGGRGGAFSCTCSASVPEQLKGAREEIKLIIQNTYSNPILIRLGWHDAGTYDKNINEWPKCGGANGSLRFTVELNHAANADDLKMEYLAGLHNALKLLEPVTAKFPKISYADLFQLASATAIELAGGPKIPMKYGRVETAGPEDCVREGNLPDAGPPNPAEHLRNVFYRMGLTDKEIVALSGAHTLGRSRPDRSGWGKPETKYTKDGPGAPGGQSWTVQWLKFDNSYFKDIKEQRDADLLVLPTDAVLFEDASFKVYAEQYAENQETFFKDYASAHKKLSELGAKFDPPEGIYIDEFP